jgi:hypothetical protein
MNLDLYLLGRAARTAVYFIGQTLVTSYHRGSVIPSCASTSRSSPKPPPKLLPAWATTCDRRHAVASVFSAEASPALARGGWSRQRPVQRQVLCALQVPPRSHGNHLGHDQSADRRQLSGTSLSGDHPSVVRGDHLGLVRLVDFRDTWREGRCQDRPWWHREPVHRYGPLTPKGEEPASWTRSSR